MSLSTNSKEQSADDKEQRDAKRIETNKTDPQITELKGFFDPKEPLEEEGTINPLTGNPKDPE
ncbi:hypothetical protein [Segetibacter aerophilus]|uniref:Uncharacterized protein n=1 Tax=Segetibacter aerophilus TaxID=670293 RepID=A0A512B7D7_9BACT|nr:hypothetical protein [Segetibacter aerophilus]GEO07717.1 hypothetical protein SAE01_02130 [Segetibacter aerophilus]